MLQADEATIQLITRTLTSKGWLDLPAHGMSMYPLIREQDICRFVPCEPSELRKGDIVLFHAPTGQLVAHRVHHTLTLHQERHWVCKGDTNVSYDEPIPPHRIIGQLLHIQKHRRTIHANQRLFRIWGSMMVSFLPLTWFLRMLMYRSRS